MITGLENSRLAGAKGQSYLLQRKIGQGNSACVYRCIDVNDPARTRYACKVISKLSWDERTRGNLIREISILRDVHHENVLTMHDLLETGDLIFIIMPFMGGGELFEKISSGGHFSEHEARRVLTQIARGIEYLHSRGICHRDLKPENILCTDEPEDYRVVISDFGLSKVFGRGELMSTSCGTAHYAAPEIFMGRPYTEACDMWSFGAVAYVLLTGTFPFAGPRDQLPNLICSGKFNRRNLEIRRISAPAIRFLERLLVVDQTARATASQILTDPWLVGTDMPHVDLSASASSLASLTATAEPDEDFEDDTAM